MVNFVEDEGILPCVYGELAELKPDCSQINNAADRWQPQAQKYFLKQMDSISTQPVKKIHSCIISNNDHW